MWCRTEKTVQSGQAVLGLVTWMKHPEAKEKLSNKKVPLLIYRHVFCESANRFFVVRHYAACRYRVFAVLITYYSAVGILSEFYKLLNDLSFFRGHFIVGGFNRVCRPDLLSVVKKKFSEQFPRYSLNNSLGGVQAASFV